MCRQDTGQEESRSWWFLFSFRASKVVVSCDFHLLPVISLTLSTVCVVVSVFSEVNRAVGLSHLPHQTPEAPSPEDSLQAKFPGLRK